MTGREGSSPARSARPQDGTDRGAGSLLGDREPETSSMTGHDGTGRISPAALDAISQAVAAELGARAVPSTREWWTRYLKGTASFRGVKMADTRRVALHINADFELADATTEDVLTVALHLIGQPTTEDKLCGILLLAEHHLERLETGHVDQLAAPLAAGDLADWNSCDWYCVKVLGPFIANGDPETRARGVARWAVSENLWQRRAAAVAFVNLAPQPPLFPGFDALVLSIAEANVADPTRWSQTSVGWLLRELSRRNPDSVVAFVDAHTLRLSAEARRTALSKLR